MPRYREIVLRVVGPDEPIMGPGKAELIARINEHGSISAAARAMGMSYRRAWMLVEALNASFREPIVATEIGGRRGGGAAVTPFGLKLLAVYRRMEARAAKAIARDMARINRLRRKRRRPRGKRD